MDCYFHRAVPSVARCTRCGKPVCATCRAAGTACSSCRLAERIDAAAARRRVLDGGVGASSPPRRAVVGVRPESRALAALGYPFWPLALLALLDPSGTPFVRRNAWQALGFNAGMYGLGWLLSAIAAIPFVGLSAWALLPFVIPVTIVASIVYAIKVWHGGDARVPFVSDIVDRALGTPSAP